MKLRQPDAHGRTVEARLEEFLLEHFGGYTATAGNIWGKWRGPDGQEHYGEHREFKVAFAGQEHVPLLERWLARIAAEIGESTIYLEIGEDAWLVYADASA